MFFIHKPSSNNCVSSSNNVVFYLTMCMYVCMCLCICLCISVYISVCIRDFGALEATTCMSRLSKLCARFLGDPPRSLLHILSLFWRLLFAFCWCHIVVIASMCTKLILPYHSISLVSLHSLTPSLPHAVYHITPSLPPTSLTRRSWLLHLITPSPPHSIYHITRITPPFPHHPSLLSRQATVASPSASKMWLPIPAWCTSKPLSSQRAND